MKTKLIALVALAAGMAAGIDNDLPEGAEFELEADAAEPLLTQGKAKLADAPPAAPRAERSLKARVLVACQHGQPNDVVELATSIAKTAEKEGLLDTDKAAVAFAAALPQNQAKKRG